MNAIEFLKRLSEKEDVSITFGSEDRPILIYPLGNGKWNLVVEHIDINTPSHLRSIIPPRREYNNLTVEKILKILFSDEEEWLR